MNESTIDMMQIDAQLETLEFQIYAYQKCKEYDHQSLTEFNLDVIKTLCRDIFHKLERKGCEHCRGWDSRCGANYCPMCGRDLRKEDAE